MKFIFILSLDIASNSIIIVRDVIVRCDTKCEMTVHVFADMFHVYDPFRNSAVDIVAGHLTHTQRSYIHCIHEQARYLHTQDFTLNLAMYMWVLFLFQISCHCTHYAWNPIAIGMGARRRKYHKSRRRDKETYESAAIFIIKF